MASRVFRQIYEQSFIVVGIGHDSSAPGDISGSRATGTQCKPIVCHPSICFKTCYNRFIAYSAPTL